LFFANGLFARFCFGFFSVWRGLKNGFQQVECFEEGAFEGAFAEQARSAVRGRKDQAQGVAQHEAAQLALKQPQNQSKVRRDLVFRFPR
jgi:hypothetical protein